MTFIEKGHLGDEVLRVQLRLGVLETMPYFGPLTDEAVRIFQEDNGLKVDGRVGPLTRAKLFKTAEPVAVASVRPESALSADEKRNLVNVIARSYLGRSDPTPFWERCGVHEPYPHSWCGAFVLSCLIEAELCDWKWKFATELDPSCGFCFRLGRPMRKPQGIADVAYFDANQHHALVGAIDWEHETFEAINGNGEGGRVALSKHPVPFSAVAGFYPIASLL